MLQVEVDRRELNRLTTAMNRWRRLVEGDLLRRVSDRVAKHARHRTRSPDGEAWAPRVEPTGSWPLLDKTGKLRKSIRSVRMGSAETHVGTDVPYAHFLQRGTKKMSARPILGVGAEDVGDIEKLIQAWVDRRLD